MDGDLMGIRLAGLGGQGVVMAGLLLGHAAVHAGLHAAGSSTYGAQSRGSLCQAEVVISRSPIDYPRIELAEILVSMSQEGYDAYARQTAPDGCIFYDSGLVSQPRGRTEKRAFDVASLTVNELKDAQAANVVWTGILAGATHWFAEPDLEHAIREHIAERYVELNLKALRLGLALGRA